MSAKESRNSFFNSLNSLRAIDNCYNLNCKFKKLTARKKENKAVYSHVS